MRAHVTSSYFLTSWAVYDQAFTADRRVYLLYCILPFSVFASLTWTFSLSSVCFWTGLIIVRTILAFLVKKWIVRVCEINTPPPPWLNVECRKKKMCCYLLFNSWIIKLHCSRVNFVFECCSIIVILLLMIRHFACWLNRLTESGCCNETAWLIENLHNKQSVYLVLL